MKHNLYLLLAALLFAFGLSLACGGGGDDDDSAADDDAGDDDNNDADDDNADDDSGDDDDNDTVPPGGLTVESITQSECLDGAGGKDEPWDPEDDPTDVVQVTWENGVLKIEDLFAYTNCGFEIDVQAEIGDNNEIIVTEIGNGSVADCTCPFDFNYEITDLEPGDYTLTIKRQEVGTTSKFQVFSLPFTFGDENKKWYVPFVEVFMAGALEQPFTARYAACYLYHIDDQMFMVRDYGELWHLFSYDWFNVDDPGEPDPNCQMPVNVEIGNMPAGDYHFGAPSFSEGAWSMLTFEVSF